MENSPFPINVVHPNKAVVRLLQPEEAENKYLVRRELDIALDAAEGARNMTATVEGPDNDTVPSSFDKGNDGLYHAKFVPYQPGTYKVRLSFLTRYVRSSIISNTVSFCFAKRHQTSVNH